MFSRLKSFKKGGQGADEPSLDAGGKSNVVSVSAPPAATTSNDVLALPVRVRVGDREDVLIKIDASYRFQEFALIVGWRSKRLPISIQDEQGELPCQCFVVSRLDVSAHLGVQDDGLGFALLIRNLPEQNRLLITISSADGQARTQGLPFLLSVPNEASAVRFPAVDELLDILLDELPQFSPGWCAAVTAKGGDNGAVPQAKAYIETAMACPTTGSGVAAGWIALASSEAFLWLEGEDGKVHPMTNAYHRQRADVADLFGAELYTANEQPGFVVALQGIKPGERLMLKAYVDGGLQQLAEVEVAPLSQKMVEVVTALFGLVQGMTRFSDYCESVVMPVIEPLIANDRASWQQYSVVSRTFGRQVETPLVSVIVPLYGNTRFVEHQLLEFARDRWFLEHAELVYVLDDPRLVDGFPPLASALHEAYGVPMRMVWGRVNRGFSGANNLGASQSRGEYLLFLNSDAFPQQPGWLKSLLETYQAQPDAAILGARLTFADGSIQHAGMEFKHRADLGIWINYHPMAGLDPALDPHAEVVEMPAVTGACMLMSRKVFASLDGWDTGYLIGDFEDSDLCFKARELGMRVLYDPAVQLTHLERQTFSMLGAGEFRTRVTVLNAVRHQMRWSESLKAEGGHQ